MSDRDLPYEPEYLLEPEPEPEPSKSLPDPAIVAAEILLAEALDSEPGLRARFVRYGAVLAVRAPSEAWCVPYFVAALRALPKSRVGSGRRFEMASGRERGHGRHNMLELQHSVSAGLGALVVSHDPEGLLLPELLRAADVVLDVPPPGTGHLHQVAARLTGQRWPRIVRPSAELTPGQLRLAVRPGQSAADYVGRVLALVASEPKPPAPKPLPGLDGLCGMDEAVAWGWGLAADLSAYRQGRLPWADVDRGCLLAGPPGTGKTTYAQRLASECGVPLVAGSFSLWDTASKEGYLSDLLRNMRKCFADARAKAPCILLIDELDAIPARSSGARHADYWNAVTACLLECLDGVGGREGVVVVGASNYPERVDPAVLRSGRLDRVIRIDLPDAQAMEGILREHLGGDVAAQDLSRAALLGLGGTGADAERWCRGARRRARQAGRALVLADLVEEIAAGDEGRPASELLRVAYHEAGHALVALADGTAVVNKLSIVRRGQTGGHADLSIERHEGDAADTVRGILRWLLAGRAAEEVALGAPGIGSGGPPESDLARATLVAASAELAWGQGHLIWRGDPTPSDLPQMLALHRDVAVAVEERLADAYAGARDLIEERRPQLEALAHALLERRVMSGDEARAVLQAAASGTVSERDPRSLAYGGDTSADAGLLGPA